MLLPAWKQEPGVSNLQGASQAARYGCRDARAGVDAALERLGGRDSVVLDAGRSANRWYDERPRRTYEAMPSKTAKMRMGGKGAAARRPALLRTTLRAGKPAAKLGWRVGRVVVRRKARARIERLGATGRTVASFAVIYGPMAAEVFGLVEAPKPKRRAPAFAAGVLIGAGAMYVVTRNSRD